MVGGVAVVAVLLVVLVVLVVPFSQITSLLAHHTLQLVFNIARGKRANAGK